MHNVNVSFEKSRTFCHLGKAITMELFLYLFLLSRSSGWLVGWLDEEVFSLLVLLIGSWLVGEVEENLAI